MTVVVIKICPICNRIIRTIFGQEVCACSK